MKRILVTVAVVFAMSAPILARAAATVTTPDAATEKQYKSLEERVSQLEKEKADKAKEEKVEKDMDTLWKDGVQFSYEKQGIRMRFGGLIQNDWLWWGGDSNIHRVYGSYNNFGNGPSLNDGTEFRRARLYMEGLLYDHVNFKAEFDFATGTVELKDVWIGLTAVPYVGNIRVGHMKEPFSLEELTSDPNVTFIERNMADAFTPQRNTGIMINNNYNERVTWALGLFRDTNDQGAGFGDNEYNVTARVTAMPVRIDDGKIFWTIGSSYSYRNPTNNTIRYSTRPEAHLAPIFITTQLPNGSDILSQGVNLVGAETAFEFGPFSLQGEWIGSFVSTEFGPNPEFSGWYAQASYFLTGENRPYKGDIGIFGQVKPKKVFMDGKGGMGAWEVAARYSYMTLQDAGFANGKVQDTTLGVNWYLNPNTRISMNYIMSNPNPNGFAQLFVTRFQLFI